MLGFPPQAFLAFENHIAPLAFAILAFLANARVEDFHPALFVGGGVSVEVDDFAVVEPDAETFFDKHVSLFFFCEAGLAALAPFSTGFFLGQSTAIVNQLGSIGEVNRGTGLAS